MVGPFHLKEGYVMMNSKNIFLFYLFISLFISLSITSFANEKSLCGDQDQRLRSDLAPVARVRRPENKGGCTLTMIGKSCAVSAGHCLNSLVQAEFNVPDSEDGFSVSPKPEDIYWVDPTSIKSDVRPRGRGTSRPLGRDWAVMKLLPNSLTGKYAGEVQGFLELELHKLPVGSNIQITGHGSSKDPFLSFTQQTHTGKVTEVNRRRVVFHRADTTPGNSGSALISEKTQKIVGIHTHGGCSHQSTHNSGTLLLGNTAFENAISECLADEAKF